MTFVSVLAHTFYPELGNRWDDAAFRSAIDRHITPTSVVLDVGAGRGMIPQMNLHGLVAHVAGLDPSDAILQNPYLDEAKIGVAEAIPWPDATFDLVIANNVLEHLPKPLEAFREIRRVLKPGGIFLAKTPNRCHYVALASALTPHWFHEWFWAKHDTAAEDIFPTVYAANTRGALRRLATKSGLAVDSIQTLEGRPEYLRATALTYALGIAYERLVNSSQVFSDLRVILMPCFRRA